MWGLAFLMTLAKDFGIFKAPAAGVFKLAIKPGLGLSL